MTAQNGFGAVQAGNCDDIITMAGYGVVAEGGFDYESGSEINGSPITGYGNSLTPTGVIQSTNVDFPPIVPQYFPSYGYRDLKPPYGPIAAGKYQTIESRDYDTLTFTGGDYYMKELIVKDATTVRLAPGNYFISEKLELGERSQIVVVPSGPVNLYIKKDFVGKPGSRINPDGDTGNLVLYLYDDGSIDMDEYVVFNGAIYSPGASSEIEFDTDSTITGAIWSAGEVELDEDTQMYYTAGTSSQVQEALGCAESTGPDHYRIDHTGSALTCQGAAVTVRACADADCSTLYSDDVVIDLSPAGWIGGDSQVLSGGSGVFQLRHTTPGTVTLSVTSQDPAADSAPQCTDGAGGASCDLTFHEAGFLFDVPDLTAGSLVQNIPITAVRADATAERCIGDAGFANTTRNLYFWSGYQQPATGTRPVTVNGSAIAGASPGTAVQLSFDAQAQSQLAIRYADAGRVELSARYTGSGDEAGLVMIGSDSFVAAPHHLQIQATTNGTTPLDNAASSGDPHWPAGEDFSVAVSGIASDGSLTPNFAATTTLAAIAATPAPGTFSGGPLTASDYSGGVATGSAAYSEVGTVTLQAKASDYLGSGIDIIGSAVLGRFTPYRFDVSLNSPEFAPACAAGGFTYIGQIFEYATAPVITVTARNKSGAVTGNYTQAWWKITSASLTGKTYAAATGTLDLTGLPAVDPVVSDLGGGIGLLTFGHGAGIHFVRDDTPQSPFDAEISLAIDVLDEDGIAATANPVTFGAPAAGSGIPFSADGKAMLWGRLALTNAYGSERVPLDMPLRAEVFDGTAFVTHTLDGCTGTPLGLLSLSNTGPAVTADNPIAVGGGTSSATVSDPFVAGDAGLQFSPPDAEGFIDVRVDLSSRAWLRYDWNGDGVQDDPAARATFGIYKGRPSLIFMREVFR